MRKYILPIAIIFTLISCDKEDSKFNFDNDNTLETVNRHKVDLKVSNNNTINITNYNETGLDFEIKEFLVSTGNNNSEATKQYEITSKMGGTNSLTVTLNKTIALNGISTVTHRATH